MLLNLTTLPTNIGGISIPDAVNGPLTALYGQGNYTKSTLRYPRDLGSNPARKHSIVFTVKKIEPQNLIAVVNSFSTAATQTIEAGGAVVKNAVSAGLSQGIIAAGKAGAETALNEAASVGSAWQQAGSDLSKFSLKPDTKVVATVGLYIPDNVNVSYSVGYDDNESLSQNLGRFYFLAQGATSLANAFKDQTDKSLTNLVNVAGNDPYVRDLAFSTLGKLTGTNLTRMALSAGGYAMNPQLQVLFRGIGFRTFQFDFVFTPYNKQESADVQRIIQTFKYHSAPEITEGVLGAGYYYKIPETFDIGFYYGNEENRNVNRIGQCVLEDVSVDYSGSGQWATFNDGSPNQIKMSLRFKETIIIDKNRIGDPQNPGTSGGGY